MTRASNLADRLWETAQQAARDHADRLLERQHRYPDPFIEHVLAAVKSVDTHPYTGPYSDAGDWDEYLREVIYAALQAADEYRASLTHVDTKEDSQEPNFRTTTCSNELEHVEGRADQPPTEARPSTPDGEGER